MIASYSIHDTNIAFYILFSFQNRCGIALWDCHFLSSYDNNWFLQHCIPVVIQFNFKKSFVVEVWCSFCRWLIWNTHCRGCMDVWGAIQVVMMLCYYLKYKNQKKARLIYILYCCWFLFAYCTFDALPSTIFLLLYLLLEQYVIVVEVVFFDTPDIFPSCMVMWWSSCMVVEFDDYLFDFIRNGIRVPHHVKETNLSMPSTGF